MATNFPSSLDSFTNPTAVDTLDSPPHDTQHADANDAIEALQAKVGADSSAVTTSHDYKISALETDVSTNTTDITNINELQIVSTGSNRTLALSDAGKLIQFTDSGTETCTVPPNSSVAFPIGTQILVVQEGTGQVTLAAGAGVTINSKDGNLKLSAQYCAATLIKRATDTWYAIGDLSA